MSQLLTVCVCIVFCFAFRGLYSCWAAFDSFEMQLRSGLWNAFWKWSNRLKERGATIYKILHWKSLHGGVLAKSGGGDWTGVYLCPNSCRSKVSITLFLKPQTNTNASFPSRVPLPLISFEGVTPWLSIQVRLPSILLQIKFMSPHIASGSTEPFAFM